jgi:hypothetical protein
MCKLDLVSLASPAEKRSTSKKNDPAKDDRKGKKKKYAAP